MSGYRIERLIGTGGMAVVYEARRLLPGGHALRVACKVMRDERRDEPRDRAQVSHEAALGLRVTHDHPNVASVLDCFEDAEERLCIVMELVDGGSVADLLDAHERLPVPVARRIVQEVLQALDHLHGQSVLHRDLSPSNILVSASGAVKIADLGLARVVEQGQVHTETLSVTLPYASPEALQSARLDAGSDLYMLGAVLYELLAGTPPCGEERTLAGVSLRTLREDFAPLPSDALAELAELATGLLRTDRDARQPRSAADALAFLRRHDQPVASKAELAAMVVAMQAQRAAGPALAIPGALAPGHVLVPRAIPEPGPPEPAAMPRDAAAPAQPERPRRVTAEFVVPAPRKISLIHTDHDAPRPSSAITRVASLALLAVSCLALGVLLHGRFQREHDMQPPAAPAPIAERTPALPVLERPPAPPVPITPPAPIAERPPVPPPVAERTPAPDETTGPPRVRKRATGDHPARIRAESRAQRVQRAGPRWRPVVLRSEPPPWATP